MTIGPEPMIRIFLMSVLLGMCILDEGREGRRGEVAGKEAKHDQCCNCWMNLHSHASPFALAPFAPRLIPVLTHHGFEFFEKIARVVRAGGGFRVVLDAERWKDLCRKPSRV